MRFRSRQHLRRQADFAAIRSEGRRLFGAAFVFSWRRRDPQPGLDLPRFAVVASRRVGPAVVRNRLKRQLREIFRAHQGELPVAVDIIATLRPGAGKAPFAVLETEFVKAARRSGLFDAPSEPTTKLVRDSADAT